MVLVAVDDLNKMLLLFAVRHNLILLFKVSQKIGAQMYSLI